MSSPWNGGTLTTAGNLVFQGTADGRFVAYNATTGEKLWEIADRHRRGRGTRNLHDRRQAIRVDRGRLGRRVSASLQRATELQSPGTVYTFAVDGNAPLPAFVEYQTEGLLAGVKYDPNARARRHAALCLSNCVFCHGVPGVDRGGNVRNLGYVRPRQSRNLKASCSRARSATRACPISPAS